MSITRYQANIVLNQWFNTTGTTIPANYYIALSTTSPVFSTGLGYTEPVGLGYTRVGISSSTGFSTSTLNTLSNAVAITFPESSGSWGTVTYVCIFDTITGGNLIWYEALTTPRTVATLTVVNFPIGSLTVTLSN